METSGHVAEKSVETFCRTAEKVWKLPAVLRKKCGNLLPDCGKKCGNFLPDCGKKCGNFRPGCGKKCGNFLPDCGKKCGNSGRVAEKSVETSGRVAEKSVETFRWSAEKNVEKFVETALKRVHSKLVPRFEFRMHRFQGSFHKFFHTFFRRPAESFHAFSTGPSPLEPAIGTSGARRAQRASKGRLCGWACAFADMQELATGSRKMFLVYLFDGLQARFQE